MTAAADAGYGYYYSGYGYYKPYHSSYSYYNTAVLLLSVLLPAAPLPLRHLDAALRLLLQPAIAASTGDATTSRPRVTRS
jgi:hypothetical protein